MTKKRPLAYENKTDQIHEIKYKNEKYIYNFYQKNKNITTNKQKCWNFTKPKVTTSPHQNSHIDCIVSNEFCIIFK